MISLVGWCFSALCLFLLFCVLVLSFLFLLFCVLVLYVILLFCVVLVFYFVAAECFCCSIGCSKKERRKKNIWMVVS